MTNRYPFKIVSESSISAGTRRIEAVAGCAAVQWYEQRTSSVAKLARIMSCASEAVVVRVEKLIENGREVEARLSQLEVIAAVARLDQRPKYKWSNGTNTLMMLLAHTDDAELLGNKSLKAAVEAIRSRENAIVVLFLPSGVVMVAAVESSSANDILESVLQQDALSSGNKRSGCPPFAQGKIKDAEWTKTLLQFPDELAIKLKFVSK
jgi:alanyl-tRNA synthetase